MGITCSVGVSSECHDFGVVTVISTYLVSDMEKWAIFVPSEHRNPCISFVFICSAFFVLLSKARNATVRHRYAVGQDPDYGPIFANFSRN